MRLFMTRAVAVLLLGISSAIPAAEPKANDGKINVAAGEIVYFQLTDTTHDKISPIVRVENPNRDYSVVRATFEIEESGAGRLKVRNGYDDALAYSLCTEQGKPGLVIILRPGAVGDTPLSASTKKISLCDVHIMSRQAMDLGKRVKSPESMLRLLVP